MFFWFGQNYHILQIDQGSLIFYLKVLVLLMKKNPCRFYKITQQLVGNLLFSMIIIWDNYMEGT
jgi:hypothetical protein